MTGPLPLTTMLAAFLLLFVLSSTVHGLSGWEQATLPNTNTAELVEGLRRHWNKNNGTISADLSHRDLIIGGFPAQKNRYSYFAYVVMMGLDNQPVSTCGGVLVYTDFVLTSAHCYVPRNDAGTLGGVLILPNYYLNNALLVLLNDAISVNRVFWPSDYRSEETTNFVYNDLALMRLTEAVPDTTAETVSWNTNPLVPEDLAVVRMLGQGLTGPPDGDSKQPDTLQEVDLKVVAFDDCNDADSYNGKIENENMICVLGIGAVRHSFLVSLSLFAVSHAFFVQKGTCLGDSGGPGFIPGTDASSDLVVGIISFASPTCVAPDKPTVLARVSSWSNRIEATICGFSEHLEDPMPPYCDTQAPTASPIPAIPSGDTQAFLAEYRLQPQGDCNAGRVLFDLECMAESEVLVVVSSDDNPVGCRYTGMTTATCSATPLAGRFTVTFLCQGPSGANLLAKASSYEQDAGCRGSGSMLTVMNVYAVCDFLQDEMRYVPIDGAMACDPPQFFFETETQDFCAIFFDCVGSCLGDQPALAASVTSVPADCHEISDRINLTRPPTTTSTPTVMPSTLPSISPSELPTLLPTSVPSLVPSVSIVPSQAPTRRPSFGACFSATSTVDVKNKGQIPMHELQIGDEVKTGPDNTYSLFYSFAHKAADVSTDFVQIHTDSSLQTSPLELTGNHMVLVGEQFIPASLVREGDTLVLGSGGTARVVRVGTVWRIGVYSPFTHTGTIVVNGVVASSFVAFHDSAFVMVGNVKTPFSYQWVGLRFETIHRLTCQLALDWCRDERYTEDGLSYWVSGPGKATKWLMRQHSLVVGLLLVPIFTLLNVLWLFESLALGIIQINVDGIWVAATAVLGGIVFLLMSVEKKLAVKWGTGKICK